MNLSVPGIPPASASHNKPNQTYPRPLSPLAFWATLVTDAELLNLAIKVRLSIRISPATTVPTGMVALSVLTMPAVMDHVEQHLGGHDPEADSGHTGEHKPEPTFTMLPGQSRGM